MRIIHITFFFIILCITYLQVTTSNSMSSNTSTVGNGDGAVNFLAPWTYSYFIRASIERLKNALAENLEAVHALNHLQEVFRQVDRASPAFLYDFSNLLLTESGAAGINLQESYLRMQAKSATDELELSKFSHIAEFQLLSMRAISLCKVLSRIPNQMVDRRAFLETIKEIASSIKQLLDTTNAVIALVPHCYQPLVEKRKREFVQVSKRFSNTLKDYFKHQESNQVFIAANQLIWQTMKLCMSIRDRIQLA